MQKQKKPLVNLLKGVLSEELKIKLQKIFRIYVCNNYVINDISEIIMIEPKINCRFIPITLDNCHRVRDFREEGRISQYRDKLNHKEIGYFAEYEGKMIGSIWATINKTEVPCVVQTFFKLMPNEGMFHDIVVSENFRRMRIGAFMESSMPASLFKEFGLSRLITDVNIENRGSLGMLEKVGFRIDNKTLYVSVFGRSVVQLIIKKYN